MSYRPSPGAMESTKDIETRLPLIGGRLERIAQTFSDRHGLRVIFQKDQCKTDMVGTVVLPTNVAELADEDMDLVWAKVNHEAEHVKVQVESEQAAQDRANVSINDAIWQRTKAMVTPHLAKLVVRPGARCSKALTPVGLLKSLHAPRPIDAASLIAMMFNVVEDVRIERRAGARYRGVAQHLQAGRDHAHKTWTERLGADPYAADPVYQVGCGIIFMAWDYDYSFMCAEAQVIIKALGGFHDLLDEDTLDSVWDAWNLALCYADALYSAGASISMEELEGLMMPGGEGDEDGDGGTEDGPSAKGKPAPGGEDEDGDEAGSGAKGAGEEDGDDGAGSEDGDEDGDGSGEDGDGDDGKPGEEDSSKVIEGTQDQSVTTDDEGGGKKGDDGERKGGGWTNAKRDESAESPDMTPVTALEAMKALSRATPKLTESPIHEATDAAIVKQAGAAPTNMAAADGATDYNVHPDAAKGDCIMTPLVSPVTLRNAERLTAATSQESATLAARMRTLLATRSQATRVYAQRNGRLDRRAMWRANVRQPGQRPTDNVYSRVIPGETHDVAIKLLGDCSGSMSGDKFRLMQQGILLLGDALDIINRTTPNRIQVSATGFTAGDSVTHHTRSSPWGRLSPIEHYNWCGWDDEWSQVRSRVAAEVRLWENADPDSVKWALNELRGRTAKRRILMVLSDGQPAAPGHSGKMRRELKASIQAAIDAGIEVWGFGMMDDSVRHYYPNHRTCYDLSQMSRLILEVAPFWFNLHKRRAA